MTINELVQTVTDWSRVKGWHENWELGQKLLLVNSEITEAFEEIRNKRLTDEIYHHAIEVGQYPNGEPILEDDPKPEGFPIELADAVIRIADICGYYGIDLEAAIRLKLEYNNTREYRHGGKLA